MDDAVTAQHEGEYYLEVWDGRLVFVKQLREHLAERFPEARVYDWDEAAAPEPSVEQMIEAMGRYGYEVEIWQESDRWYADQTAWKADAERLSANGDTVHEAVAALYRAWRERE